MNDSEEYTVANFNFDSIIYDANPNFERHNVNTISVTKEVSVPSVESKLSNYQESKCILL